MIERRVAAIAVFRTTVLIRVCCRPNETRASLCCYTDVASGWGLGVLGRSTVGGRIFLRTGSHEDDCGIQI